MDSWSIEVVSYHIDIQHACEGIVPVTDETLTQWVTTTLALHCAAAELTLRFVDLKEITNLNRLYRKKNSPTNVLAFPASHPSTIELDVPLLGDVIVCPAVLKQESNELNKPLIAHWAHIVIHGVLHLLGYDHIEEDDALKMQALEVQLLAQFNFDNPYEIEAN
jgi:probable rRNA maturation factor